MISYTLHFNPITFPSLCYLAACQSIPLLRLQIYFRQCHPASDWKSVKLLVSNLFSIFLFNFFSVFTCDFGLALGITPLGKKKKLSAWSQVSVQWMVCLVHFVSASASPVGYRTGFCPENELLMAKGPWEGQIPMLGHMGSLDVW